MTDKSKPAKAQPDKPNLTQSLKELEAIAAWFDEQQEVDVEEGLTKVREAAKLIKDSKLRLAAIENEFQEIEKEIGDDEPAETADHGPVDVNDIPF